MKQLYQSIVAPYVTGDYPTFLRARYLRFVNVTLFLVVPFIIAGNLLFLDGCRLELLLPLGVLLCLSIFNLALLAQGKLAIAAHTLFWSFMSGVWAIMFTDQGSALIRMNTIVFAFAVLSMLPLMVQEKRWLIPLYFAVNLGIFIVYSWQDLRHSDITTLEQYDYLLDNIISMIFMGISSYGIFTVSRKALQRTQREIRSVEKTRQLLDRIVAAMPSALCSVDGNGMVTSMNEIAATLGGSQSKGAIGKDLFAVFPSLNSRKERIQDVIAGAAPLSEKKVTLRTGANVRVYDLAVYPLVRDAKEGAVIRLDDVSSQVTLEQMMVQNEKMLSVGRLAAGMAHEINNPLGGILQSLQVIEQRLDPELERNVTAAADSGTNLTSIRRYLEKRGIMTSLSNMNKSGRTTARIVANMLSFSRKTVGGRTSCDLADLLEEVLEIAKSDYDLMKNYDFRKIKIVRDYDKSTPLIACEPSEIQQVMLNILRNGAQAMAQTASAERPAILRFSTFRKAEMACIRIEDNGPGMDDETMNHIFEPFFTTKEVGKGTGLGLSVSYYIITENHRGILDVDSQPGQGSTFTIGLPIEP